MDQKFAVNRTIGDNRRVLGHADMTIKQVMQDPALRLQAVSIDVEPIGGSHAQAECDFKAGIEK